MESTILLWGILFVIFVTTELVANNLIGIWFAIAAIIALILGLFGVDFNIQVIEFITVSVILLFATRKFVKKVKTPNDYKTNSDAVIGQKGKVLVQIEPFKPGVVKIGALEWTAVSRSEQIYNVDEIVEVIAIEGVKVVLK
jgi:membrane protein implicated in regulation of membrane protease activity